MFSPARQRTQQSGHDRSPYSLPDLTPCDDDAKAGVGGARLWRLGLKPLGGIVGPFAYKN